MSNHSTRNYRSYFTRPQNYIGLWFHYDNDIAIYWNRSKSKTHTFYVWNNGKEVNYFTVNESLTPKKAEENADEWLTERLQEEMVDNADLN